MSIISKAEPSVVTTAGESVHFRYAICEDFPEIVSILKKDGRTKVTQEDVRLQCLAPNMMPYVATSLLSVQPTSEMLHQYVEEARAKGDRRYERALGGISWEKVEKEHCESGVVGWMLADTITRWHTFFEELCVKESERRHGIGTLLLSRLKGMLSWYNRRFIRCLIEDKNRGANDFLRSQGFRATGGGKIRYDRNRADDILLAALSKTCGFLTLFSFAGPFQTICRETSRSRAMLYESRLIKKLRCSARTISSAAGFAPAEAERTF